MTTIYNYSAITGEYVSSEIAEISPLDPENILIPANATVIAPPTPSKGEVAIFLNGAWSIELDMRGINYWMPDFSMHYQNSIGPLPEGATTTPPENHLGTIYWLPDGSKHLMQTYGPLPVDALLSPPPPTKQETIDLLTSSVQSSLDAGAALWGYDNVISAASYAASTNKQYAADAAALIGWRDEVWTWATAQFPNVIAGENPESFMATMPAQPAQPKVS